MAERTLRDGAGELGLPHDRERLDEVGEALVALRTVLAALWPAVDASRHFDAEHARVHAELAQAERDLAEQAVRLREAEHEHAQLAARHATLAATVGAAVEELHRQLAAVAEELRENRRQREQADRRRLDAKGEEGRQNGLREQLTVELERVTVDRLEQVETLRRFAGTGLVAVALPDLDVPPADGDWGVTAALRFARQIEQGLAGIADDDSAWNTVQRHASEELNVLADALRRHGHNASAQIEDDALRVEVVFRGHATTVPAVAGALEDEVRDREQLLNEREREILENHLVNEIASTLQELIASAEVEVGRMNAELAERPTSTGMRLRLVWRPVADGPPGLAVARERLLRQTARCLVRGRPRGSRRVPTGADSGRAGARHWRDVGRPAHRGARLPRLARVPYRAPSGWQMEIGDWASLGRRARAGRQRAAVRGGFRALRVSDESARAEDCAARRGVRRCR